MFKLLKSATSSTNIGTAKLPEGERVYAIGDVHGRNDMLVNLLDMIEHDAGNTPYRLVFLGDYIDRGPTSRDVIETLIHCQNARPNSIFLMGNHEQVMLDFIAEPYETDSWLDWGGLATLESYGLHEPEMIAPPALRDSLVEKIPDTHFTFLMDLKPWWQSGDYVFVHAGLRAGTPLEDQLEEDLFWIRKDFFEADKEAFNDKVIVHGHTPVPKAQDAGWRINVDTGAVWTGKLTAVCLENNTRRFLVT